MVSACTQPSSLSQRPLDDDVGEEHEYVKPFWGSTTPVFRAKEA